MEGRQTTHSENWFQDRDGWQSNKMICTIYYYTWYTEVRHRRNITAPCRLPPCLGESEHCGHWFQCSEEPPARASPKPFHSPPPAFRSTWKNSSGNAPLVLKPRERNDLPRIPHSGQTSGLLSLWPLSQPSASGSVPACSPVDWNGCRGQREAPDRDSPSPTGLLCSS